MAISLVQTARSQTNGTSTTATFASAPTVGNVLIAFAYTNSSIAALNVSGWTAIELNYSGSAQSIGVYYKVSDGTETSVTSNGATISRLHISEWSGLAVPIALDGSNSSTSNGVTIVPTGSITTTNAENLLVAVGGISTGGTITATWSGSFNALLQDATSPRLFSAYRITSLAGIYQTSGTLNTTNSNSGAMIIAFKAATPPPQPAAFFNFF